MNGSGLESLVGAPIPALVDLQVNGYRGIDVNAPDFSVDDLAHLTDELRRRGTTRFLPTLITGSEERLLRTLRVIAEGRRAHPAIRHSVPGVHMEGPHISALDGPRGAHDRRWIRPADPDELQRWWEASEGLLRVVTLAPEVDGAAEYTTAATALGIRVSIGHADPTPEQVGALATAGATLSTHLGNGCMTVMPRHPNPLWSQLADDRLTATLITDGHHLPADTVTTMIRAKGPGRALLVSDASPLAGSAPGVYDSTIGGSVTIDDDGALRLTGTAMLAGSARTLLDCVRWADSATPIASATLWHMASETPARILDLDHDDRVRLIRTPGGVEIGETIVAGEVVYRHPGAPH